jgi:hypothetical protein
MSASPCCVQKTGSCPAADKLQAWLDAGAPERLVIKTEDFDGEVFSLRRLLFACSFPRRLLQCRRTFCSWLGMILPLTSWKVFWYRRAGVKIGQHVFFSPTAAIDPLFPQLVTLGDGVVLGMGAMVMAHVYTPERLVLGRVAVGNKALVGGFAALSITTMGEASILASNSFTSNPIPANRLAIGVPAVVQEAGTHENEERPNGTTTQSA